MATRMQQRRGVASEWATANPILADGEIGVERDTGIIKVGNGTTPWNTLLAAFSSQYLPILGKAADSDKLDGFNSDAFLQTVDAPTVIANNTTNHARDRGTGTTLPTTDLRRGDVYYWETIGSLMRHDGVRWRQATEGVGVVATTLFLPSAASMYDGFQVFVTSRNTMYRVWNLGGTLTWKMAEPYCRLVFEVDATLPTGNVAVNHWSKATAFGGLDLDNMAPNAGGANQFINIAVPGLYDIMIINHITTGAGVFIASRIIRNATANTATTANEIGVEDRIMDSANEATFNTPAPAFALVANDKLSLELWVGSGAPVLRKASPFAAGMLSRFIVQYRGPIPTAGT